MARRAGMGLRERWADWSRAPFTDESPDLQTATLPELAAILS